MKLLILLKIWNTIDIKARLALMVYKFLNKKSSATSTNKFAGSGIKNENISNKELV